MKRCGRGVGWDENVLSLSSLFAAFGVVEDKAGGGDSVTQNLRQK